MIAPKFLKDTANFWNQSTIVIVLGLNVCLKIDSLVSLRTKILNLVMPFLFQNVYAHCVQKLITLLVVALGLKIWMSINVSKMLNVLGFAPIACQRDIKSTIAPIHSSASFVLALIIVFCIGLSQLWSPSQQLLYVTPQDAINWDELY